MHLHVHSEFSPIDSLVRVPDLVQAAAKDGNPAIALTDHGTLGGIWKLGQRAGAAGIKAIPGQEFYLAIGSRHEHNSIDVARTEAAKSKRYEHLTVLAATRPGWHNLVALSNKAQDSYWYKPRIDYELLTEHADGLVVLTGCLGGPVAGALARGDDAGAHAALEQLCEAVGYDRVFVEVMDHGIPEQAAVLPGLRALASEYGLLLVATNDAHYPRPDQAEAHDAWLAVGTRAKVSDVDRFRFHGHGHHLRTESEMRALNVEDWWQEACGNTLRVAQLVDDDVLPDPALRLPTFPLPEHPDWRDDGVAPTSSAMLRDLVRQGARERYGEDPGRRGRLPREVNARLKAEFAVVESMGLSDYFLITWDLVTWARSDRGMPTADHPDGAPGGKEPIRVGPGRGSAAGSVISYCLGIVNLDPIAHGLLFERFLDPTRTGMPDIDSDFEQARRDEILAYLQARYGRDHVARLGTYGMAATRAAIKDAARVLGLTSLGSRLTPLVPIIDAHPATFAVLDDTSVPAGAAFRNAVKAAGGDGARLVALARDFEGVTKLEGIHACGTLIADEPMDQVVPLRRDRSKGAGPDALRITSWDGKDVEDYGLLKLDVLGLRTLDVISVTLRFIETSTGLHIDPDGLTPGDGSARDRAAWELVADGRTAAVFQLESDGITRLAQAIAPSSLADLTALVALYRPGPMGVGAHEMYAARKNNREAISYDYLTQDPAEMEAIASVLAETYGLPIYQEQVMLLASVVGGLDAGMRNLLRKAFSKKDAQSLAQVRQAMFDGAIAGHGISGVQFTATTLERLWALFESSASYLFNKSHAATYGLLTYQTAYLKASWPVEFAAAVLATTDAEKKRLAILTDLQREGIEVRAPDVNRSALTTVPDDRAVLLGLSEVKGVGADAAAIIAERERGGPFASMAELFARVSVSGSTLRINLVEALVEVGAFDSFGPRLGHLMITRAVRDWPDLVTPEVEWGVLERGARERARLGLTTGTSPLITLRAKIGAAARSALRTGEAITNSVADVADGSRCTMVGILTAWAQRGYSKGQMANLTLECADGSLSGVMWDDDLSRLDETPVVGSVVLVRGRVRAQRVEVESISDDGEMTVEQIIRRDLTIHSMAALDIEKPVPVALPDGELLAWPENDEVMSELLELPLERDQDGSEAKASPEMSNQIVVHRIGIGTIVHSDDVLDLFDEVGYPPPCLYTTEGSAAVTSRTTGIAVVVVGERTLVPTDADVRANLPAEGAWGVVGRG
ncbi:DNA polymerase III subunit alpha [Promicromonospora sp. NPDC057138]|uniref:DNA polymerase III subunit alpha n=1 Tax=Promicromonospora sp. NPDC057138 TaxID=3346031 RepID=UPI00363CA26E